MVARSINYMMCLSLLTALFVLLSPAVSNAGAAKAKVSTAKKGTDPTAKRNSKSIARTKAANKGQQTKRMKQKANSNWAARVKQNPKLNKPGAKEAFVKRSVRSQKAWQVRKASQARSQSAKKGWETRRTNQAAAEKRSDRAKRGWDTRRAKQRSIERNRPGQRWNRFANRVKSRVARRGRLTRGATTLALMPKAQRQFVKEIRQRAKNAGYAGWDFYAVTNLTKKSEIRQFTQIYAKAFPTLAAKNIEFAVEGGRAASGTEAKWKNALAEVTGNGN